MRFVFSGSVNVSLQPSLLFYQTFLKLPCLLGTQILQMTFVPLAVSVIVHRKSAHRNTLLWLRPLLRRPHSCVQMFLHPERKMSPRVSPNSLAYPETVMANNTLQAPEDNLSLPRHRSGHVMVSGRSSCPWSKRLQMTRRLSDCAGAATAHFCHCFHS